KHVPVPRWAVAVAERLPGGKTKTVTRRSAAGSRPASGPAREPDLFGDGERRFRAEPTRRAPRERYEQTQLLDTSGSRQRPGQESMLDELGNVDMPAGGPGPAAGGTERLNPKDIRFGDTIILRRRDYTPKGPLGPERVEEHRVARVEVARHGPTGVSYVFYDADGHIIKGAAH